MIKIGQILEFFERRPRFGLAVAFVAVACVYGFAQASPTFLDPDSFYHARMTVLTSEMGPVRDFPWLPFTVLKDAFADHHFLYHVAAVPFARQFGPFVGLKIITVLLGALAVVTFAAAARALGIRHSWLLALALAFTSDFMLRMNLAKASSLSVIFLMLGLACLVRGRLWPLFFLSWFYVWAYGGWPLLPVMAAAFAMIGVAADAAMSRRGLTWRALDWFRTVIQRLRIPRAEFHVTLLRGFLVSLVGAAVGLVVNPFFPTNLKFYWYQTVQIALVNHADKISVGQEWYPYSLGDIAFRNGIALAFTVAVLALGTASLILGPEVAKKVRQDAREITVLFALAVLSLAFLVLTLKSKRNVEYLLPFVFLFDAALLQALLRRVDLRALAAGAMGSARRLWRVALVAYLLAAATILAVKDVTSTAYVLTHGIPWSKYESLASWASERVPEGSTIFYSEWSDFAALFYRLPQMRFVIGLDPTFLYLKSPELYRVWRDGVTGETDIGSAMRMFGSEYVVVRSDETELTRRLNADSDFALVYQDDDAKLFAKLNLLQ